MGTLFTLLEKEIRLELRSLETIVLVPTLSFILSVIVGLGISGAFISPETSLKIFPSLLWLVFFFAATLSVSRGFEIERNNEALQGILLTGVDPGLIYFAKVLLQTVLVSFTALLAYIFLGLLTSASVFPLESSIVLVMLVASLAYSALSVLLSAVASWTKLKNLFLPVVLIPLLMPVFFGAIECTNEILITNNFALDSSWLALLFVCSVIYTISGYNLYRYVVWH